MEIDAGKVTRCAVWISTTDPIEETDSYVKFTFNNLFPNWDEIGYTPDIFDFILYSGTGRIYIVSYIEEDIITCDRYFNI